MRADKELSARGTSYFGVQFQCTFNELKMLLGEPHFEDTDGTNYQWNVANNNGRTCTVYDYYTSYWTINAGNNIYWHIGGLDMYSCLQLYTEMEEQLKYLRVKNH